MSKYTCTQSEKIYKLHLLVNLKHATNTHSLLQEQKKMALNKSQNFS